MTQQCPFHAADLGAPANIADPYPAYAALRPNSPCFGYADRAPGATPPDASPPAAWAVLKYDDVVRVARDHDAFSSVGSAPGVLLVNDDPPTHTRLRILTEAVLATTNVQYTVAAIERIVAETLAEIGDSEVDAIATIAAPVAARVATHFFGLDEAFLSTCRRWGTALMLSGPVSRDEQGAAFTEMVNYFSRVIATNNTVLEPTRAKSVIDALCTVTVDGQRFTPDEILKFCLSHIVSGVDTVMYLLGNALAILSERPDLFARLRGSPALVRPLREEVLRFCGPAQRMYRVAVQDVEVSGQTIRAGDLVALFFGAANRDPAIFPAPDDIRLDRSNADAHLSFGAGIHRCPGQNLVNLELDCLINALLSHFTHLKPGAATTVRQTTTLLQNGYVSLPLIFSR